jgi:hypothetical protein
VLEKGKFMNKPNILYGVSLLLAAVGIAGFASANPGPTKGQMPDEAFENGTIRADLAPDFIATLDRDGKPVGYVSKVELVGEKAGDGKLVVWDDALTRPVGHLVPGRGFVPFGVAEEQFPAIETKVTWESVKDKK